MVILFIILISAISHWWWTTGTSILAHGDWYYQSVQTLRELLTIPFIWNTSSFGVISITSSFYPFQFLYGLMASINMSYGVSERIIFLLPIVIICPVASYILIKNITQSKLSSAVGSLVYTYNTYFLMIQTGHLTLMVAFSLAPLIIYLYQKTLKSKHMSFALLTGILLFIASFYEFRAFYIIVWILLLYYLYHQFVITKKLTIRNLLVNAVYAGLPIIIVGLLNIYWILAFSQLGTLTSNEIFNRSLFGNELININNAFTLFHPFWTGVRPTEFIPQPISLYFWLIPLFAFVGLILHRRNKNILFFGFIALIGVLLTKQVSEPFSNLYLWLYNNLPGFNAYREASKFFFLIALGYSVLIAAFVDWLWKNWTKGKLKIYGKYTLTILIAAIFLWNTKPLITGEIGSLFVPRTIPIDYKKIEAHLLSEDTFYRTFWIPTYSRWSFYSNTHPQVSAVLELNGSWRDIMQEEIETNKFSEGELMIQLLQKEEANNLLDVSSIKYVFVPIQDFENDDDFFRHYGLERVEYINSLDKLDYLERVDLGTDDIVVYENSEYKPHIYITPEIESLNKVVPYEDVDFKFVNPTHYTVNLNNITEPIYLNYSESFHPQWKLLIGDFSWYDAVVQSDYFIPDTNHSRNDANLNSYYINPEELCAVYECNRNPDGSYSMNVTLYFLPQSYVYVGGIISLMTLFAILGFFAFKLYEKKR